MSDEVLKSGFVAIAGRPNVGKSTLMNCLIGQKIAIMSSKPQTTRERIKTVYTDKRGQIVFLDTPGLMKPKNKLGDYMRSETLGGIEDADEILYIVEAKPYIGKHDDLIVDLLAKQKVPIVVAINKCDSSSQKDILETIRLYSERLGDAEIVPISARKGQNTDELLDCLFKYLPEGPMYYDEDTVTDIPVKALAGEIIREKALHALNEEVPHGIAVVIDKYKQRKDGIYDIEATIFCEKDSHKGIIIGKGGQMLKKIGTNARFELERETEGKVNLKLWVKVDKDWRSKGGSLKNFGYAK